VRDNGRYRLPPDGPPTLAEQFQAAGYATAACVGCFVLDRRFGLDRGFEHYDFQVGAGGHLPHMPDFNERDARLVTDAALAWLGARDRDRPWFLWVHYFDPHRPYRSPLADRPEFAGRPYAAEIAHMDAELGRLLTGIDRDRTLVIVVGDHGESLGEHGEPTHGLFLYDSTVRVPLILTGPGLDGRAWRLDDRLVSLVDLLPTLVDLLALPDAPPSDGVSLLAPVDPDRAVYLETELPLGTWGWSPLVALRTLDEKFVEAPSPESYDLAADPDELDDRRRRDPQAGADLRRRLTALRAGWDEARPRSERTIDPDEARRLASLGYVHGDRPDAGALPDPKDMLAVQGRVLEAEERYAHRDWQGAAELAAAALRDDPDLTAAVRVLAFSQRRLGQADEGIDLLRRAAARRLDPYLARSLVQLLILEGRYDAAQDALAQYAALAPDDGRVDLLRGDIHARQGDPDAARRCYEAARERDPNRVGPTAVERLARLDRGSR
jgi:hypothetical protein